MSAGFFEVNTQRHQLYAPPNHHHVLIFVLEVSSKRAQPQAIINTQIIPVAVIVFRQ